MTDSLLPVIAIVGRPNVGKSTLFNALTESRAALTSDFSGLTRDRQYGNGYLAGHHFIVIDTGGLANETDEMSQLTEQQSLQAIQEANVVFFVVDARVGIDPLDQWIAGKLRRFNKHIILVANKTESLDPDIATADFYALGMGLPVPISAAHKSGTSELIEYAFTRDASDESSSDEKPADDSIKLAVIGRPNVGKSTLINRMLGEERMVVADLPGTTRDSIYVKLERLGKQYTLIDTAGVRRRGKIFMAVEKFSVVKTLQAIDACDVVLFIMDANEGVTEPDLKLLGFILESGKSLVIAMNKWDGLSEDAKHHARMTIDRRLPFLSFVRIHFISALHGSGVGKIFPSIEEAYHSAQGSHSTPQLTDLLEDAVQRHSPPMVRGRRIRLRYAHLGGKSPLIIIIHGNQTHALPKSYQRYLSNFYQQRLKVMGSPVHVQFKNSNNPYRQKQT